MTTRHLTPFELERYLAGALDDRAAADVEQHVASCVACRTLVDDRTVATVASVRRALDDNPDDHIGYEEMAAFVDGTLPSSQAADVQMHLERCESCALDYDALGIERAHLQPPAAVQAPARLAPGWLLPLAATLVATVALGAWWITAHSAAPAPASQAATQTPAARTDPSGARLVLADGAHELRLDANGDVSGLPALPTEQTAAVVAALSTGTLPVGDALAGLRGTTDVLMGGGSRPAATLTPSNEVVESDRPEFTWSAVPGTTGYTVTVLDAALHVVATSPALDVRRWIPVDPLPRGRTYQWQVAATTASGRVVLPAPPMPEARFTVLAGADEAALRAARETGSNLVVAVLSARAGLLADAERALLELSRENPDSKLATGLLEQARRARR